MAYRGRPRRYTPHLKLRIVLAIFLSFAFYSASARPSESALRVAFVYNFFKFIEWPNADSEQFHLCVIGARGDTRKTLQTMEGRKLQGRELAVDYLDSETQINESLGECNLLYLPASGGDLILPEILPLGVLLVADAETLDQPNVCIALRRSADSRIEILIDKERVLATGVIMSSQLLKLARNLRERTG